MTFDDATSAARKAFGRNAFVRARMDSSGWILTVTIKGAPKSSRDVHETFAPIGPLESALALLAGCTSRRGGRG